MWCNQREILRGCGKSNDSSSLTTRNSRRQVNSDSSTKPAIIAKVQRKQELGISIGRSYESSKTTSRTVRSRINRVTTSSFMRYPSENRKLNFNAKPLDPAGQLYDLSNRNILCSSLRDGKVMFGGADHRIYSVDLQTSYFEHYSDYAGGHREWITCVVQAVDGSVVSGCTGGKICQWNANDCLSRAGIKTCIAIEAHSESGVSFLDLDNSGTIISCGYDGSNKIWNMSPNSLPSLKSELRHCGFETSPILDCFWGGTTLVAAHRSGNLNEWDPVAEKHIRLIPAHKGHATVVRAATYNGNHDCSSESAFFSGGQDGFICKWDNRCALCVSKFPAHRSKRGIGSVGGIHVKGDSQIVSYGADCAISITDARKGVDCRLNSHGRDFIYTMKVINDTVISGSGTGLVLLHDLTSRVLMYGLQCNKGAVRCLEVSTDALITAGDDGNAIVYQFPRI